MTRLYDDHADIYDLAFDWDVSEDVVWLHARLGSGCRSVLEPGCGSGRIVEALAQRGLEVVGLDRSPRMIEIARTRLAGLENASVILADITGFSLGRLFDGAVCPINTLLHLSPSDLCRHLDAMAEHLRPGARYLVQLALYDHEDREAALRASKWEMTRNDTALRITWATEEIEPSKARLRQRSRIEIVSGARAGEVLEETHEMTAWTPERWRAAVARSAFRSAAIYDGDRDARARVPEGSTGPMLWHELIRV
jgi:SAM-dependent methyltransferase